MFWFLLAMCLWVNALCVSNEYSVEVLLLLLDTSSSAAVVGKYRYRSLDTLLKAVDDTRGNHNGAKDFMNYIVCT